MFTVEPEVMKMFSFVPKGVTDPNELRGNERFLRHASKYYSPVSYMIKLMWLQFMNKMLFLICVLELQDWTEIIYVNES